MHALHAAHNETLLPLWDESSSDILLLTKAATCPDALPAPPTFNSGCQAPFTVLLVYFDGKKLRARKSKCPTLRLIHDCAYNILLIIVFINHEAKYQACVYQGTLIQLACLGVHHFVYRVPDIPKLRKTIKTIVRTDPSRTANTAAVSAATNTSIQFI